MSDTTSDLPVPPHFPTITPRPPCLCSLLLCLTSNAVYPSTSTGPAHAEQCAHSLLHRSCIGTVYWCGQARTHAHTHSHTHTHTHTHICGSEVRNMRPASSPVFGPSAVGCSTQNVSGHHCARMSCSKSVSQILMGIEQTKPKNASGSSAATKKAATHPCSSTEAALKPPATLIPSGAQWVEGNCSGSIEGGCFPC